MMADSIDARKLERKALFDVPLPMRRTQHSATAEDNAQTEPPNPSSSPGMVKFSLLSKRGNRAQA
jgi:regulator of nonsense transcripts 2